jgi:hypothetical protein
MGSIASERLKWYLRSALAQERTHVAGTNGERDPAAQIANAERRAYRLRLRGGYLGRRPRRTAPAPPDHPEGVQAQPLLLP